MLLRVWWTFFFRFVVTYLWKTKNNLWCIIFTPMLVIYKYAAIHFLINTLQYHLYSQCTMTTVCGEYFSNYLWRQSVSFTMIMHRTTKKIPTTFFLLMPERDLCEEITWKKKWNNFLNDDIILFYYFLFLYL